MNLDTNWKYIRRIFAEAFRSSFHYSMATVTPDGLPHVTPVGSLNISRAEGIYIGKTTRECWNGFGARDPAAR